ncbi:MAG: hypothetical protein J6B54_00210 [Clostridia bacterium]|nr:hypothetical protein [Clostridia bacterium]
MKKKFTLKLCLATVALLTVIAVAGIFSFAQPVVTEVSTEAELRAAVANGGEIKLTSGILIGDFGVGTIAPIVVEKDTVLDLNGFPLELTTSGSKSLFTVCGASLTVNGIEGSNSFLGYNGDGSVFRVVGAEGKETSVTVNYAQVYARQGGDFQNPLFPAGNFEILAEGNATVPTVTINGGRFFCQNGETSWLGPVVAGKTEALTVKGGEFGTDPSAYLLENYAALREWDNYYVRPIATEYSEAFQKYLDEDGNFVIKYYQPEEGEPLDPLFDTLSMSEEPLTFYLSTLDETNSTIYVSLYNRESGEILETHLVHFVFRCDPAIREMVKDIIELIPEDPNGYYFTVKDMELINYWMSMDEEREYTGSLMQYSGEFRELVNYRNFSLDPRMGWDTPFYTEYFGPGNFMHDGTVYGMIEIGAKAQHILYVPDNTPENRQALIAAAQQRIDEYLGENSGITVSYADTAQECYYRWYFKYFSWEWEQYLPNATYDEWRQSAYVPAVDDGELQLCSGIQGLTTTDDCFQVVINGVTHYLFILPDSSNMVSPVCKTADAVTNVTISSNNPTLPLDTMIQIEKLTEGTEYENVLDVLDVDVHETFDIKLHSQSLDQYITTLDNGKFEVAIPIPQEWEGKDLIVYYVDENNQVTDYPVTYSDDERWAIFVTDHFSIYTLAEKAGDDTNSGNGSTDSITGGSSSDTTDSTTDDTTDSVTGGSSNVTNGSASGGASGNATQGGAQGSTQVQNPSTADRNIAILPTALLMGVILTAVTVLFLKRKKS